MRQVHGECATDYSDKSDTNSSTTICETASCTQSEMATININTSTFIQDEASPFAKTSKTPENSSLEEEVQCFNLISESESSCSVVELSQNQSIIPLKPPEIEATTSTQKVAVENTCGKFSPIAPSKADAQPSASSSSVQLLDESTTTQTTDETYQSLLQTYELLKSLCGEELKAFRVVAEIQRLGANLLTGVADMDKYIHCLHTIIRKFGN